MSVAAADLIGLFRSHRLRVFTTSDLATLAGFDGVAAAQALGRLETKGLVCRLKRGVWANRLAPGLNPYEAVAALRAPWPCYVSLYSVLADRGIIAEIPQGVYAVSASLPRSFRTPLASYSIHHLPERFMWGYEFSDTGEASYPEADAEKAFLDLAYLSLIPRSKLALPRPRGRWALDRPKLGAYARRFGFAPLTKLLRKEKLLG